MSGERSAKASPVNNQKNGDFPSGYNRTAQQGLLGVDVLLVSSPHRFRGTKLGLKSWFSSLRAHLCDPGCGRSSEPASVPPRKHSHILTNILPPGLSPLMAELPLSLGPL